MDKLENIRLEEKMYHEFCYDNYNLFESGSWLHRPVQTVLDLLAEYKDYANLSVLDLGAGIGRNSIPIAESMKIRKGKIVCVDLLKSAIDKLEDYSREYGVEQFIETKLSDIENFNIKQDEYDIIIAVSALEHVRSEREMELKIEEMTIGTKINGTNCIVVGTNIKETRMKDAQQLEPMFEVNISTESMMELLKHQYIGWEVKKRLVKQLEYEIERNKQLVKLSMDCITFVAKKLV